MKTRKMSISMQLFLFILGASLVVALIVGGVSYSTMGRFLRQKTMGNVMEIAVIAAENVDGETFLKATEGDEEALAEVKDSLSFFLTGDSVTYVYTLMPKDENNFQFVVDTDPDDPGEYAEDYEAQDAMFEAMEGKASVTQEAFTDEWGTFYSGYAPIIQNGKTLGIVAVDYEASSIQSSLNHLIRNILLSVVIGILFAVIAAAIVAVRMRNNFIKVNDKILEVASDDGDLTKVLDIASGDELEVIGDSLNQLLKKTANTVRQIKGGTDNIKFKMESINTNVSGSASQITNINDMIQAMVASSEEIAASAGTVGERVDYVYKDIQSIVDIVAQNTNNLKEIHVSSQELNETAKSSTKKIEENVEHMSAGMQKERERAEAVLRIKELSDSILSISSQTNLLALNASIEAARAGEAGRGFEVVAHEIETLARNTSEAANEIQTMSSDVVEAVEGLAHLAEQMLSFLRNEISEDYERFSNASRNFMGKSDDIRISMEQLQKITEQYEESLKSINDVMQSVSAASEETSSEIVHVSEILLSMNTDMKNIEASTEETFQNISGMNKELSAYRIDMSEDFS
ncbi:MAG: methyl-accepting chemotaxis protein [Clostridium sp.]|nr:methyl-accepting chemotaxis protein [Clostridium sp.]MCM1551051.1 methyl-accepting chemotaxis protein [Clostridium sp.]